MGKRIGDNIWCAWTYSILMGGFIYSSGHANASNPAIMGTKDIVTRRRPNTPSRCYVDHAHEQMSRNRSLLSDYMESFKQWPRPRHVIARF